MPYLDRLSAERVREELLKALAAPAASPALRLYRESGALAAIVPELAGQESHAWEEVCRAIDTLPAQRLRLRLVTLLAPAASTLESLLTRLRFSNAEIRDVVALGRALAVPLPARDDVVGARRWLRDVTPERGRDALRLHFARARGQGLGRAERGELAAQGRLVLAIMRKGDPVTIGDLAIDGNDLKRLGLRPSPEFASILEHCLEAVLADPEINRRERLLELVRRRLQR